MKDNKIKDERVMSQRRKIQSDAYQILIICLLISILIQQFILAAPFSQFAAPFFCLFGMAIYVTARHLSMGIDIWNSPESTTKSILLSGITLGGIGAALMAILAGEKNIFFIAMFFICFTAVYVVMHLIFKKKQKQIEDDLNEKEVGAD